MSRIFDQRHWSGMNHFLRAVIFSSLLSWALSSCGQIVTKGNVFSSLPEAPTSDAGQLPAGDTDGGRPCTPGQEVDSWPGQGALRHRKQSTKSRSQKATSTAVTA